MAAMKDFQPHRRAFMVATALLAVAPVRAQGRKFRVVALGDSLSAGYGLPPAAAFPNVLERVLKARELNVAVENAGVSGDTASGGRDRVDWSVADGTDLVIVELGANDALRGVDPKVTEAALDEIMTRLKARRINVLLAGMLAPPNNGPEYGRAFNGLYGRLAAKHRVPLYPFFLEGVAGNPKLNLPDGIHPTAAGIEEIVRRIAPLVEETLKGLSTPA
ncbi:MAG: arylesterase [Beijerinckiaceae bacterium]